MFDPNAPSHWYPSARLPKITEVTEAEIREAIRNVVTYSWGDERADFDNNPDEGHIYRDLRVLHALVFGGASVRTKNKREEATA